MFAADLKSSFEPEVSPPMLLGRLGSIFRELEQTCNDFQEALSHNLHADTPMPAAMISRLQEIDRVSQTLGSLAAFASALESAPSSDLMDIGHALDHVRLHAVRDILRGLIIPYTDVIDQAEPELF